MFCQRCGQPLEPETSRCLRCGTTPAPPSEVPTLSYADSASDWASRDLPVYVLRPRFIAWYALLPVLPFTLFLAGWLFGVFSGLNAGQWLFAGKLGPVPLRILHGCAALAIPSAIPLVAHIVRKRTYARTEYRFYRDRLEYLDGSPSTEPRVIPYQTLQVTQLTRDVIQRYYDLGTIIL